ncbi:hypothetical protein ACEQ8H_001342 [Pleosporales sp. CAS-2024a]
MKTDPESLTHDSEHTKLTSCDLQIISVFSIQKIFMPAVTSCDMAVIINGRVENVGNYSEERSVSQFEGVTWPDNDAGHQDIAKKILRDIWGELLSEDPSMFTDEDIFFEVRGDSISAQKLINVSKNHGICLTMEQIFMHASLSEMAQVAIMTNSNGESADTEDFAIVGKPIAHGTQSVEIIEAIIKQSGLEKLDFDRAYPCSPMQEALLAGFENGNIQYLRQFVFSLPLALPLEHFFQVWEDVMDANPILRTRIYHLESTMGYVQAIVRQPQQWNMLNVNLDRFLEWDATNRMYAGSHLFRYNVVTERNEKEVRQHFVWTIHHAVCDGASLAEILHDVSQRFHGKALPNREPFESFVRDITASSRISKEEEFWKQTLSNLSPTPFPPIPQESTYTAKPTSVYRASLTIQSTNGLGVTKALLLRTAWALLLSNYTGTEDVSFGMISSGRTVKYASGVTGPTIALVPVALRIPPDESVHSLVSRVNKHAAEMIPFEHTGIARIRKYLEKEHSTALGFQTLLVINSCSFSDAIAPSMHLLGIEYHEELGKKEDHQYPLIVTLTITTDHDIQLIIQHDQRILSTTQAESLAHHFQVVLSQVIQANMNTRVEDISPFGEHDKIQIQRWNRYTPPFEEVCIHDLFHKQVVLQPHRPAVQSVEHSLTYYHVDLHSTALAQRLVEAGVSIGAHFGVCFEKSIWTVVAALAVFKTGGVYVPIDPAHPPGRIEEIIALAEIKVAIVSGLGTAILHSMSIHVITVEGRPTPPQSAKTFTTVSLPKSIAYMLFTSGSTGKPKGILMSHRAICTSIIHQGAAFGAGPHWRTLQFCAHTFDISIAEFFTTLAHGGCVCVPDDRDRLENLAWAITSLNVNTLLVVPTVANLLQPEQVPTLKTMVLSGEPITKETVTRWADALELTCAYGPSETAVWSSANLRVSANAHPANIGHQIGTTSWIVHSDDYQKLSAIGCVGELLMTGAHLGAGYLKDKATTGAAFVPAPAWLKEMNGDTPNSALAYRSGDLGRYNPDGTIQIVGRRDTQVKLRGYRIELGDIENRIMATGKVTAALSMLPKSGPCARQLVAIVSFTKSDLRNHNKAVIVIARTEDNILESLKLDLLGSLPEYMVPTVWIVLGDMPLLISGKIDRKAINTWLHDMTQEMYQSLINTLNSQEVGDIEPNSPAHLLRHLSSSVLSVPKDSIGRNTSFISIGGDSIAAIQIISQAKIQGLPLTVRDLLNTKSLDVLAKVAAHRAGSRGDSSKAQMEQKGEHLQRSEIPKSFEKALQSRLMEQPAVKIEDVFPLAPFQREIMRQRTADARIFLMSWEMEVWSLTGQQNLSLESLARAWVAVVRRFPILRSVFLSGTSNMLDAVQVVLSSNVEPHMAITTAEAHETEPCFPSTNLPPVDDCFLPHRAHFTQHGDRYFVHIEADHLVIDGWSFKIIKEAFLKAYDDPDNAMLSTAPTSYRSFVAAHHEQRVHADDTHWDSFVEDILQRKPDIAFEYVVSGRDDDEIPNVLDMVGPLINVLPYHIKDVSIQHGPGGIASLAHRMQDQRAEDSAHTASNVREVVERSVEKRLFNTALNFQRRPTAVQSDTVKVDDDLRKSRDPWHFDVLVRVLYITDDDTFRPSLEFDATEFDADSMGEVANDFWARVAAVAGVVE